MMISRYFFLLLLCVGHCMAAKAQHHPASLPVDRDGFRTTAAGLKYIFHEDRQEGRKVNKGEIITFRFSLYATGINGKDSLLGSSDNMPGGVATLPVKEAPAFPGSFEEGLMWMSEGDSAHFLMPANALMSQLFNTDLRGFPDPKGQVRIAMRLLKVQSVAEFLKEQELVMREQERAKHAMAEAYSKIDDDKIIAYLEKNKLVAKKTASGMYYRIIKEGSGVRAGKGSIAIVHYAGWLLEEGTRFDSSYERGEPFAFQPGSLQVVAGFNEAISLLKKGGKIICYFPSALAYGAEGALPSIPPYAVLIFEIELVNVK